MKLVGNFGPRMAQALGPVSSRISAIERLMVRLLIVVFTTPIHKDSLFIKKTEPHTLHRMMISISGMMTIGSGKSKQVHHCLHKLNCQI